MMDDASPAMQTWTPVEEECLLSLVSARVHPWIKWDLVAAIFQQEFGPLHLYTPEIVRCKFYSLRQRWRDRDSAPALLYGNDGMMMPPATAPLPFAVNPDPEPAPVFRILEKISPQMPLKWISEDQLLAEASLTPLSPINPEATPPFSSAAVFNSPAPLQASAAFDPSMPLQASATASETKISPHLSAAAPSNASSSPSNRLSDEWSDDEQTYLQDLAATFDRKWDVLARLMREHFPGRRSYTVENIRARLKDVTVAPKSPGLSVDLFYRFNQENKIRNGARPTTSSPKDDKMPVVNISGDAVNNIPSCSGGEPITQEYEEVADIDNNEADIPASKVAEEIVPFCSNAGSIPEPSFNGVPNAALVPAQPDPVEHYPDGFYAQPVDSHQDVYHEYPNMGNDVVFYTCDGPYYPQMTIPDTDGAVDSYGNVGYCPPDLSNNIDGGVETFTGFDNTQLPYDANATCEPIIDHENAVADSNGAVESFPYADNTHETFAGDDAGQCADIAVESAAGADNATEEPSFSFDKTVESFPDANKANEPSVGADNAIEPSFNVNETAESFPDTNKVNESSAGADNTQETFAGNDAGQSLLGADEAFESAAGTDSAAVSLSNIGKTVESFPDAHKDNESSAEADNTAEGIPDVGEAVEASCCSISGANNPASESLCDVDKALGSYNVDNVVELPTESHSNADMACESVDIAAESISIAEEIVQSYSIANKAIESCSSIDNDVELSFNTDKCLETHSDVNDVIEVAPNVDNTTSAVEPHASADMIVEPCSNADKVVTSSSNAETAAISDLAVESPTVGCDTVEASANVADESCTDADTVVEVGIEASDDNLAKSCLNDVMIKTSHISANANEVPNVNIADSSPDAIMVQSSVNVDNLVDAAIGSCSNVISAEPSPNAIAIESSTIVDNTVDVAIGSSSNGDAAIPSPNAITLESSTNIHNAADVTIESLSNVNIGESSLNAITIASSTNIDNAVDVAIESSSDINIDESSPNAITIKSSTNVDNAVDAAIGSSSNVNIGESSANAITIEASTNIDNAADVAIESSFNVNIDESAPNAITIESSTNDAVDAAIGSCSNVIIEAIVVESSRSADNDVGNASSSSNVNIAESPNAIISEACPEADSVTEVAIDSHSDVNIAESSTAVIVDLSENVAAKSFTPINNALECVPNLHKTSDCVLAANTIIEALPVSGDTLGVTLPLDQDDGAMIPAGGSEILPLSASKDSTPLPDPIICLDDNDHHRKQIEEIAQPPADSDRDHSEDLDESDRVKQISSESADAVAKVEVIDNDELEVAQHFDVGLQQVLDRTDAVEVADDVCSAEVAAKAIFAAAIPPQPPISYIQQQTDRAAVSEILSQSGELTTDSETDRRLLQIEELVDLEGDNNNTVKPELQDAKVVKSVSLSAGFGADQCEPDRTPPKLTNSHICHFNAFDDFDTMQGPGYDSPQELAHLHYQLQAPEISPLLRHCQQATVNEVLNSDIVRRAIRGIVEHIPSPARMPKSRAGHPKSLTKKSKVVNKVQNEPVPAIVHYNVAQPVEASAAKPASDFDLDEADFDLDETGANTKTVAGKRPRPRARPSKGNEKKHGPVPAVLVESAAPKKRGRPRKAAKAAVVAAEVKPPEENITISGDLNDKPVEESRDAEGPVGKSLDSVDQEKRREPDAEPVEKSLDSVDQEKRATLDAVAIEEPRDSVDQEKPEHLDAMPIEKSLDAVDQEKRGQPDAMPIEEFRDSVAEEKRGQLDAELDALLQNTIVVEALTKAQTVEPNPQQTVEENDQACSSPLIPTGSSVKSVHSATALISDASDDNVVINTRSRRARKTAVAAVKPAEPPPPVVKSGRGRRRGSKRRSSPTRVLPPRKSRRRGHDEFLSPKVPESIPDTQLHNDASINTQQSVLGDDLGPDPSANISCDTVISHNQPSLDPTPAQPTAEVPKVVKPSKIAATSGSLPEVPKVAIPSKIAICSSDSLPEAPKPAIPSKIASFSLPEVPKVAIPSEIVSPPSHTLPKPPIVAPTGAIDCAKTPSEQSWLRPGKSCLIQ